MRQSFDFEIPALPLPDALDRYTIATGRPTVYPSNLVEGRMASPLIGHYAAGDALRVLLRGTGLMVEEVRDGQTLLFVLKPVAAGVAPADDAASMVPAADHYDALVQSRVMARFCEQGATAPGAYRALLRFNIDAAGAVRRPRLIGTSGSTARDRQLTQALGTLEIGQPPPPGLAQPLTLLILPQVAGAAGDVCRPGAR